MEAGYIPVGVGNVGAGGAGAGAGSVVAPPTANVIRAPGLKRGKMEEAISDRIKLESVLGLTVSSNAALDCDPNTELVAYPAGCTVVLYNVRKNRQAHLLNASRKSVTCVTFSPDGRYLATGECGHAPAVRVWDLQDPTASAAAVQIAEFPGHTHGVSCVAFSMSSKYLVSVGSQHDMIVNVWDWKANLKLASNKVSSRVKAVSFAENGNYFVTVGFRHVKFWYLEYSRSAKFKEPVPLMGRSAILGEQKDNEFCDVRCGRGTAADSTYAITRGGLLCEFNSRRLLDKWVELRTTSANCMSIGANFIFVGCADGIVRCFSPTTLQFVTTLPRTHYLGVDVSQGLNISHMFTQPPNARYPDAVALTYDERNHKLTCVYNDHSLYVWDVRDIKRVGKSHSALYHSACIWGVDMVPSDAGSVPPGCFLTCSSDDTVRYWNLKPTAGHFPNNIYSNELQKVIYIDPDMKFLKDVDLTAPNEKDKSKSYDDKTGVRCVCISPDGLHIASGDRAGNVWIHDAPNGDLLRMLEAHDAEVLCLQYSAGRPRLLASASRDRLIHLFQVDKGYQIMQTLDDHSSSITAVRFISSSGGLQMVSCGADKTILFRQLVMTQDGGYQFARGANVSGRTTLYDMEVDAGGRHVLAACQDRNVRVYSSQHQRHTKTFRGTVADEGTLIKVALDSSGIYLATSCTDKLLSVYDYYSGECMATMFGHSEIVTGLRFTPDCQHLISASGDGCIFVWRVPHDMVVTMRARLAQQAIRQGRKLGPATNGLSGLDSETDSHFGSPPREIPDGQKMAAPQVPDYTLRIGHLPSWAKKSLGDDLKTNTEQTPTPEPPARGKWARRLNAPSDNEKRVDSDGSKDSSLDSGTDTRYVDRRREQIGKQVTILAEPRTAELRVRHHTDDSSLGSFKYEDPESTEHDGDVEDISDGERTSSEHNTNRMIYYPGNNDDTTPGEFTVNAMDVEELRQSQRRSKRWKPADKSRLELPVVSVATTSVSGSGQDSSEDDEVSTPSGDNADRNPLSGSCESIDTAGRREKYLKSAYDSLSGAELDSTLHGNTSLSAQHLLSSRSPPVAAKPSPAPRSNPAVDSEAARKREELNRRIRETRRQLESVGFRSNLKASQSTTDLSYIPEKDPNSRPVAQNRTRPVSMAIPVSSRQYAGRNHLSPHQYEDEEGTGMRRAISLSDLAVKPSPAPRTPVQVSGKLPSSGNSVISPKQYQQNPRPSSRYSSKTNMTRSSSVGVLNQSDSESDPQPPTSRNQAGTGARGNQGLMRPTISSLNKVAAGAARRRGLQTAHSSVNLTSAGQEDSSSEAEGAAGGLACKPAVPPRPRAVSIDHSASRRIGRSGSERDLSAKAREVTARLTAGGKTYVRQDSRGEQSSSDTQMSSVSALTDQLTRTAGKVVQLYRSLQHDPRAAVDSANNQQLISGLEAAILETQKVLRGAVQRQNTNPAATNGRSNGQEGLSSLSSTDGEPSRGFSNVDNTRQKLEELLSKGAPNATGNSAISVIEQYSDILLNMMQSQMVNQFTQNSSPQSLPPQNHREPSRES